MAVTPISIETQPTSRTVSVGGLAAFNVVASGGGTITYQWKKAAVEISGATAPVYIVGSAVTADAGSYTVTVTNEAGSVTSSSATLTVNALTAPVITAQPSGQTAYEGDSVTFSVIATSNGTSPTYQWKKSSSTIVGATSPQYTISSVVSGDAGNYTVVITNSVGSTTSSTAVLATAALPAIIPVDDELFGSQGTQGSVGSQGTQGIQGVQGTQGTQGLQGIQGFQGIQGTFGTQGSQGRQGIQGLQGVQGTQGIQGSQGTQGTVGLAFTIAKIYASVAALAADSSPSGIIAGQFALINTYNVEDPDNSKLYIWSGASYIYVDDLSGSAGIQGITGSQGTQGIQGLQGVQGIQGIQGINGEYAAMGLQGTQGIQGRQGIQGTSGLTGTGIQGAQGAVGSNGAQGIQGITGSNGSNGTNGTNGIQGAAGSNGSNGAQGTAGTNGSNGAQGTAGTNGASVTGAQGTAGQNGTNGTNGTNGQNGAQGTVGQNGTNGTNGTNGSPGAQGTQGSAGPGADQSLNTNSSVTFSSVTAGGFNATSSIAYKMNVTPIEDAIDLIKNLNGVIYDRKDGHKSREHGVIAEDVARVLPSVVGYKNGKPDSIDYSRFTPVLIEAIKALSDKVDELKNELKALKP
jgi:hypothetical protein